MTLKVPVKLVIGPPVSPTDTFSLILAVDQLRVCNRQREIPWHVTTMQTTYYGSLRGDNTIISRSSVRVWHGGSPDDVDSRYNRFARALRPLLLCRVSSRTPTLCVHDNYIREVSINADKPIILLEESLHGVSFYFAIFCGTFYI